jgi:D-arabinose 5-phosphate isomerase GutQ
MNNLPMSEIAFYVNYLCNFKYNIYFVGVGKSKKMALHTVDILISIVLNTFSLDPLNSMYGAIEPISNDDIIFMYSKSLNTE